MAMDQQAMQQKEAEQQTLQQMISSADDMLGQVTVEQDGPLQ